MEDMKHTIQATGHTPQTIDAAQKYEHTEMLEGDKRGVRFVLFRLEEVDGWIGKVTYETTWGTERPFTRIVHGDTLEEVADSVRNLAKSILPPGAGFPATPQFETRQAKLAGMMETLTLTALSKVLAQATGATDDS
jgi:hypothetical protein